ncbi:MAG: hypothetical protein WD491_02815, partial [Balneolales bacterium]
MVAHSQRLAAGGGHTLENDLFGSHIREFFPIGLVGHLRIEICKNRGALVIVRMIGIIDMEGFDGDPFWHVSGIAEIMVPRVAAADQAGTDGSASGWHEHAATDNDISLPRTAIIAAKIDEVR